MSISIHLGIYTILQSVGQTNTIHTHIQSSNTHYSLHRAALKESKYSFRRAKRLYKTVMTSGITMIVVTNKTPICRAHRSSWGLCAYLVVTSIYLY